MAGFSLRNLFRRSSNAQPTVQKPRKENMVVGADGKKDTINISSFDNSTITYSSALADLDYDSILRNKQSNINTLYQLADYYVDQDPIVRGIIKGVYVPFTSTGWYLTGDNQKTIEIFQEQYEKMRLRQHIDEIFYQYYKYNNVYIYIWNGNILTLPPHKCKIGNTLMNGMPVVDFNVQDIQNQFRQKTYSVLQTKGVKDNSLDDILKGYPPEVAKAIKDGDQYAQLDPNNMFVMQGTKQGWTRYAIPWISSALPALAKKQLINNYQNSMLNIGARPFVHVKFGDAKEGMDMLPDVEQLTALRSLFLSAMSDSPLAVTNHLVTATVVQADMKSLYEYPLYTQVNSDILAAGGISGIILNGASQEGSTFASAQVSTQAASFRIDAARRQFEQLMVRINQRLVEDIKLVHTNNLKDLPQFHFLPIDITGQKAFRQTCVSLWNQGVISTKTLMDTQGYSLAKQKAQREVESTDGTDAIMTARMMSNVASSTSSSSSSSNTGGRPSLSNQQRNSDPQNSTTSQQTKDAASGNIDSTDSSET